MTAQEWRKTAGTVCRADEQIFYGLIADLAVMEKLAFGGEGMTHFYYRDLAESAVANCTKERERVVAAEAERDAEKLAREFAAEESRNAQEYAIAAEKREAVLVKALTKIIEWCDGTRGPADEERDPFETIGDCARAAVAGAKEKA